MSFAPKGNRGGRSRQLQVRGQAAGIPQQGLSLQQDLGELATLDNIDAG